MCPEPQPFPQVKQLSECIFSGLAYLHCTIHAGARSKIALAHGDLRSDNILLKPNYVPVLGELCLHLYFY